MATRVPFSGIIRIRDMMYTVKDPFRLDQGDVSFDAPDTVKHAMHAAIDDNRSHYLQTTGVPRLLELLARKAADASNGIPVGGPDEVMVTNGGIHALYIVCQALLEPGDEVIVPDPEWPPCDGQHQARARGAVPCPLHERLGWRYDLDELESKITPQDTRDLHQLAAQPDRRRADARRYRADRRDRAASANSGCVSDEAYEDVVFDGAEHVSPASLPGMYERTIPVYTFSKSYAMTGLRLGYLAVQGRRAARADEEGAVLHREQRHRRSCSTAAIGALEGPQDCIEAFRTELQARRDLFYEGIREHARGRAERRAAEGRVLCVPAHRPTWCPASGATTESLSWSIARD